MESQIEIRGPGVGVDRVWRRIAVLLSQYPFTKLPTLERDARMWLLSPFYLKGAE